MLQSDNARAQFRWTIAAQVDGQHLFPTNFD